ncbi:MAG: hypothetical protein IPI22_00250 [Bacteroidetes bacterium]|nr:hypothetical protein [Bacteroidota bacterium]
MNTKILFLFLFLFSQYFMGFSQKRIPKSEREYAVKKHQFMFTVGYGAPSFVRAYLKYKKTDAGYDYKVSGVGPLIAKTEFMISNKFGVGINASFSQSKISWLADDYDTVQQAYRKFEFGIKAYEISGTVRGNYHFWKRKNIDSYAGLGIGYGLIHMWSYTFAHTTRFGIVYDFPPPISLECTWGIKYFPLKNLGIFTELGLGKSFILFNKYFIPEALVQAGLTLKL